MFQTGIAILCFRKNNRDVFTHAGQITMPVWNIIVGDAGCGIEYNDSTLARFVVAVTGTATATEFL
jgi:hypothetical protein